MFGFEIIEVAIGLSLVYLMLASICSMVRERIEAVLNTRAIDLERGIREMLDEEHASDYTAKLYSNPYIGALFRGTYSTEDLKAKWFTSLKGEKVMRRRTTLPAYIPARNFALALVDIVFRPKDGEVPPTPASLQSAINVLPNDLKNALSIALVQSRGDMDVFRRNIENWYDSAMERVSSWYKRRTQNVILLLSLVISVVVNANTLTLVERLSVDSSLRQALVEQSKSAPGDTAKAALDELGALGLPLGWSDGWPGPRVDRAKPPPPSSDTLHWWTFYVVNPIIGLLLTAFAVSLGAPVWFDVMNRLVSLRASLKPDESTPTVKPRADDKPPPDASTAAAPAILLNVAPQAFRPNEWAQGTSDEGVL